MKRTGKLGWWRAARVRGCRNAQLTTLARLSEERTAAVGDVLFRVGDRRYPFNAILEGEVAILDGAGHEIVRHRTSGFLGEMNLL
ncbi:MAG: hypothetical protein ABR569_07270 [Gaiellaceae bacterium]